MLRRLFITVCLIAALTSLTIGCAAKSQNASGEKIKTYKKLDDDHLREAEILQPNTFIELQMPLEEARRDLLAAEARIKTAKEGADDAKKLKDIEEIDRKAAKVELKAAKANNDSRRIRAAEQGLNEAELDLEVADAMVDWRKERVDAVQADARREEAAIEMYEAERDLRAVELLHAHGSLHASLYEIATFQKKYSNKVSNFEGAQRSADKAWSKANRLEREYARLARQQGRDVPLLGREYDEPVELDGDEEPIRRLPEEPEVRNLDDPDGGGAR